MQQRFIKWKKSGKKPVQLLPIPGFGSVIEGRRRRRLGGSWGFGGGRFRRRGGSGRGGRAGLLGSLVFVAAGDVACGQGCEKKAMVLVHEKGGRVVFGVKERHYPVAKIESPGSLHRPRQPLFEQLS